MAIRAVHYLNQFFAGIGGEEAATAPPEWFEGARGPGKLIAQLAPEIEVVGTLAAGDDHVAGDLAGMPSADSPCSQSAEQAMP